MTSTKYDADAMRVLAIEALHLAHNGEDAKVQLFLIGLCAQAIEGDRKAIEVLKNRGIHP